MCWQEKWGIIYNKYFFDPYPVSLKILLKFFKINHGYHPEMSHQSLHLSHH